MSERKTDGWVFPIYARFAYPDNGYVGDRSVAATHLTLGEDYLIDQMVVGGSTTTLYLHDFPGVGFNQVMFAAPSADETGAAAAHERTAELLTEVNELRQVITEMLTCVNTADMSLLDADQVDEWQARAGLAIPAEGG